MVQEGGPSQYASAEVAHFAANTGNNAADRLKQSEGSHRAESHSGPSNHKHDSAWAERRANLAMWSAVKASNSPDGRADKLNKDLV